MKAELARQYHIALTMLKGVVEDMDDDVWLARNGEFDAAWHIAYHAVFYTNIYCSPSETMVKRWEKQRDGHNILGPTPWPPHKRYVPEEFYSKADIVAFADAVLTAMPDYLAQFEPDQPCWPHWYQQNQFEFHLNNLRHIQHHIGQLIERNHGTEVEWMG